MSGLECGVDWRYRIPATEADAEELAADLSPLVRLPEGRGAGDLKAALAAADLAYAVELGGRLCGIAYFFEGDGGVATMAYLETAYLTRERRLAHARGLPALLRDAFAMWGGPYRFAAPEKARDREWFRRCGCLPDGGWMYYGAARGAAAKEGGVRWREA